MLNNNDLFSVLEICPAALDRHRETILHYSITLVLQKHEPGLLYPVAPGFHSFFTHEEDIEAITQLVFSDFLVDLFHFQPLAFIGKFLRDSAGCKLIIPNTLMNQVKELIAGTGKVTGLNRLTGNSNS